MKHAPYTVIFARYSTVPTVDFRAVAWAMWYKMPDTDLPA